MDGGFWYGQRIGNKTNYVKYKERPMWDLGLLSFWMRNMMIKLQTFYNLCPRNSWSQMMFCRPATLLCMRRGSLQESWPSGMHDVSLVGTTRRLTPNIEYSYSALVKGEGHVYFFYFTFFFLNTPYPCERSRAYLYYEHRHMCIHVYANSTLYTSYFKFSPSLISKV